MKIHTPIIALIFLCLLSCRNDKCDCDGKYKKIPDDIKPWFLFKDGSWAVYHAVGDSTIIDTVTAIGRGDGLSNKFCESYFSPAIACSEILDISFQHTNNKFFPTYSDSTKAGRKSYSAFSPYGGGQFIENQTAHGANVSMGVFLGIPIRIGEDYDGYTLMDTNSITLNGQKYFNVTHSVRTPFPDEADCIREIWWVRGVGMLRMIKNPGKKPFVIWELKENHIEL